MGFLACKKAQYMIMYLVKEIITMKKKLVVLLILAVMGSALFAAAGQFAVTPRVGYGVYDFAYEYKAGSTTKRSYYIFKGVSGGLDFSFKINPQVTAFIDAEANLPMYLAEQVRNDSKESGDMYNRKDFADRNNYDKYFGWKVNLGVLYNLMDTGRISVSAGGGVALQGIMMDYVDKTPAKVKIERNLFGAGLALKAVGNYAVSENMSIYAAFQPDVIIYTKKTIKTGGASDTSLKDGTVGFRVAPSTTVGCTFTF